MGQGKFGKVEYIWANKPKHGDVDEKISEELRIELQNSIRATFGPIDPIKLGEKIVQHASKLQEEGKFDHAIIEIPELE